MTSRVVGISGISVYLPPLRVPLEQWCAWTGNSWSKMEAVVGRSFRVRGPQHNAYTMAATAVLRLIEQYDIDPARVRFLGLGTESSTDNSAGAVIVKGMLDDALRETGRSPLARGCEVPEFKHACLGGVYALKSAVRFLLADGRGSQAIVVASDIAEYARGSTGEPTQGAGAVAMLIEEDPTIAEVRLDLGGSSSDYRGPDFRKPLNRLAGAAPRPNGQVQDLPVFNGKYSTTCYVDATLRSLEDMFDRREIDAAGYWRSLPAVFMHRPYRRMPLSGWAMGYLMALARGSETDRTELAEYCSADGIDVAEVIEELKSRPRVRSLAEEGRLDDEVHPRTARLLKAFRSTEAYRDHVEGKMELGGDLMMQVGNIYTGALFGWLAAGLEEAAAKNVELGGEEVLLVGYGSGDASEAIPLKIRDTWKVGASRIGFDRALANAVDLTREQYEQLHDEGAADGLEYPPREEFRVIRIGDSADEAFTDTGIEYYRYFGEVAGD